MTYVSIKTIRGRRYRYQQHSYRDDTGRVRTETKYLGPVDGFVRRQSGTPEDRALAVAEREAAKVDAYQRATFGETGQERKDREAKERAEKVYTNIGLNPPAPAQSPSAPSSSPASSPEPAQSSEIEPASEPSSEAAHL
jgi:hypothetical protein